MAYESYGGNVEQLLGESIATHPSLVAHRRAEEILML
jgi:hypothetical protein